MLKQLRDALSRGCEALGLGVLNTDVKEAGNKVAVSLFGTGLAVAQAVHPAHATGPDYSTLTAAADWSSVSTGIVTIGAALMAVIVVITGVGMILRAGRK